MKMERLDHKIDHEWHCAINRFTTDRHDNWPHFMYEANSVADELPRLVMLFQREREGALAKVHQQCSLSEPVPVQDNYLSCALGKRCSECPYLLALDTMKAEPEEIDTMKAWTCITHILTESGTSSSVDTSEGFLLTEDDKMYWQTVYSSLADEHEVQL